ncbi:hypothetical protein FQN55_002758 [Onygenales sp. PD_40]|nr:hypothetical protein FQN55_002758 [Onygenales sp. PD_40]KAK2793402.1 hypothetical protein FQN52_001539 [Onygenales sp. PD_12]
MAHREPAELTEKTADQGSVDKGVPGDNLPERPSSPPMYDEPPRKKHTCRRANKSPAPASARAAIHVGGAKSIRYAEPPRHGSSTRTRRSTMRLEEQTEPSIQRFADSYYTLIEEPHENKASNLPKHGKSLYEETASLGPTKPKWAYFSPIFSEIQTQTDNTRASWPSPPRFPSPSQYNTPPDSSGAFNIPAITPSKTDTTTTTTNNNNLPPFGGIYWAGTG